MVVKKVSDQSLPKEISRGSETLSLRDTARKKSDLIGIRDDYRRHQYLTQIKAGKKNGKIIYGLYVRG